MRYVTFSLLVLFSMTMLACGVEESATEGAGSNMYPVIVGVGESEGLAGTYNRSTGTVLLADSVFVPLQEAGFLYGAETEGATPAPMSKTITLDNGNPGDGLSIFNAGGEVVGHVTIEAREWLDGLDDSDGTVFFAMVIPTDCI